MVVVEVLARHQKKLTCKCWIICCNVFLLVCHALLLRLSETNNPVIVEGSSGGRAHAGDLKTVVVRNLVSYKQRKVSWKSSKQVKQRFVLKELAHCFLCKEVPAVNRKEVPTVR